MNYKDLCNDLIAITEGVPYKTANLANASALLYDRLDNINWAGFYLLEDSSLLVLGPFQGKPACIEIPVGKGVCGAAASLMQTVVVDNVHNFQGHIACDSASNSEIVVPLIKDGVLLGIQLGDFPFLIT